MASSGQASGDEGALGVFNPANVLMTGNVLSLRLKQETTGHSNGAEIQSTALYSYGLLEWTMRMGSTSATLAGAGAGVTGGVSAGFIFVNNSQTEIDFEVEGQFPHRNELSCFQQVANVQSTSRYFEDLSQSLHTYSMLWLPGTSTPTGLPVVEYYFDYLHMITFTNQVNLPIPSAPAYALLNHWGTNSINFGGTESVGVTRYQYCTRFAYTKN